MDSYEVVKRAIEFDSPDRLPVNFPRFNIADIHGVGWNQIGTGPRSQKESLDEWGCLWVRSAVDNMGQVKGHPLEKWENLTIYQWPDPNNPAFFEGMEQRFAGSTGKYITTGIFMLLFERMHALRGFQNTLEDLYLERDRIERLADRILEFDMQIIRNIATLFPGQVHGFTFSDDWGTQLDTFISPRLWKDFFQPRYKKVVDLCHSLGWHVWMHSCGKINKILPLLVDIGMDVMNLEQPRALGIETVGELVGGKISFSSGCDIQHTLPFKDEEEIYQEAHLLMQYWGTPKGGFLLSDDENDQDLGTPLHKKETALQAFLAQDRWKYPEQYG